MKALYKIFLMLSFLTSINSFSQNQTWYEIPLAPYVSNMFGRLEYIDFINANTGWTMSGGMQKMYRTTNSGVSWTTVFSPTDGYAFRSLAFFDSLYGFLGNLDTTKPLCKTTDGGFNWSVVTNYIGLKPKGICGLYKVSDSIMYGSGWYSNDARVIKTTNKGSTWQTFDLSALAKGLTDCYFFNKDSGIAVGWKGITYGSDAKGVVLFTSNGGANWVTKYTTINQGQNCWKISFPSRNVGYVSLEKSGSPTYFLKTTDGGMTWQEKLFLNQSYIMQGIGFINESTGWIGGSTLPTKYSYRTTNGGETWDSVGILKNVNKFILINDTIAFAVGRTVYRFGTPIIGINQISTVVPSEFKLFQNYPNPFNPQTNFEFWVKDNKLSEITLKVYDINGKLISTLYKGKLAQGKYNFTFDGSSLTSGLYFYSMETNNFRQTRKMVLIK